ncbi:hypothetical protein [Bacillus sp. FJAT-49736]|uniref:hypothetical protein n=1 Tax=Bacillus sp. FJAT-49736 TaxID=2833582 RepID=UPI001BCA3134|nr:hypothetical protein [Bacillus sp. FJAT-49736]MBS4175608.1 hypothetical protein [Bacillus sp. FJAT-49736]
MKSWRVGSISMGAALLFLGVFLLLTQIFHWKMATALVAWWPILLIILGVEVLLSLYFSKQEKPIVKYDILSIFFIGIIGMCGIALTIFSSTGILDKVTYAVAAETKTLDLPKFSKDLDNRIKRVVLETQNQPVTIETTDERTLSAFGTYRTEIVQNRSDMKNVDDYLMVEQKGDTIYLKLKDGPNQLEPFTNRTELSETILIPSNIRLEVEGNYNLISLKVRSLSSNWFIRHASEINIQVMGNPDLMVKANQVQELAGDGWIERKNKGNNEEAEEKHGSLTFGAGTHHIEISQTSTVSFEHLP